MKASLTVTGVGTDSNTRPLASPAGVIQVDGDGATTFQVEGRLSPNAPWFVLVASGTADVLQSVPAVPYVRLNVTAGTGTVTAYVA